MITRVIIEQFYENLEEATVGRWIKAEGDPVEREEPLVEIITDKVTFEMPAPASGSLLSIVAPEKSVLPVGYVIALIGEEADELPEIAAANEALLERRKLAVASVDSTVAAEQDAPSTARSVRDRGAVRATPAARRVAREHNIDLAEVSKSLGGGLVQEEDVLKWTRNE